MFYFVQSKLYVCILFADVFVTFPLDQISFCICRIHILLSLLLPYSNQENVFTQRLYSSYLVSSASSERINISQLSLFILRIQTKLTIIQALVHTKLSYILKFLEFRRCDPFCDPLCDPLYICVTHVTQSGSQFLPHPESTVISLKAFFKRLGLRLLS